MKMIQANCRVQFTSEDIEFILSVLGQRAGTAETLIKLLTDEESRDLILDDPELFRALLERRHCLRVSIHFYFYVMVRQAFVKSDIHDRAVADYVAEVLTEFARVEQSRCIVPGQSQPLDYFFEMIAALQKADDTSRFFLRMHIGNHSLFLSGVFAERILHRAEQRGFPALRYYEDLGRSNYRIASDHRLAQRYELSQILNTLADRFQATRNALSDVADRLFSLGEPAVSLDHLFAANENGSGQDKLGLSERGV